MNARLAVLIWVVATLVILAVTLLPLSNVRGHPHWDRVAWVPFADPHAKPLEVAANLALFVPYGFGATAFAAAIAAGAQSRGGTPWPGWRFALVAGVTMQLHRALLLRSWSLLNNPIDLRSEPRCEQPT